MLAVHQLKRSDICYAYMIGDNLMCMLDIQNEVASQIPLNEEQLAKKFLRHYIKANSDENAQTIKDDYKAMTAKLSNPSTFCSKYSSLFIPSDQLSIKASVFFMTKQLKQLNMTQKRSTMIEKLVCLYFVYILIQQKQLKN